MEIVTRPERTLTIQLREFERPAKGGKRGDETQSIEDDHRPRCNHGRDPFAHLARVERRDITLG